MISSVPASRDAGAPVVFAFDYAAIPQGDLGLRAGQAELRQKQYLEKSQ